MTEERKNEIWAMLPEDFRREATAIYKTWVAGTASSAMVKLFGKHNLTAQAEEKPKEPIFKVGEKVFVNTSKNLSPRDIDLFRYNPSYVQGVSDNGMVTVAIVTRRSVTIPIEDIVHWSDVVSNKNAENCTNPTENGISGSKIQSESAESVETSAKEDAYFAYRLDLAKEIAVAMINEDWASISVTATAIDAVDMANEIVKRLKETEI